MEKIDLDLSITEVTNGWSRPKSAGISSGPPDLCNCNPGPTGNNEKFLNFQNYIVPKNINNNGRPINPTGHNEGLQFSMVTTLSNWTRYSELCRVRFYRFFICVMPSDTEEEYESCICIFTCHVWTHVAHACPRVKYLFFLHKILV